MRVAVSGARGFVGRSLIRRLGRDGAEVTGLVRSAPAWRSEVAIGDLSEEGALELPPFDAVVHLAARVHVMDETERDPLPAYRRVNVEGTRKLLQAAQAAGVRRFVFASTIKVLGEETEPDSPFTQDAPPMPDDPYAISKLEAEQLVTTFCTKHGIEWTIVRPVLVFGPGVGANFAQLMRLVARERPLPLARVRNARSLLYVENLSAFLSMATTHPMLANRIVNLADPPALSSGELVRRLAEAMGVRARLFPVPAALLEAAAKLVGRGGAVRRLTRSLQVDTDSLFQEMRWHPPTPWDQALRETTSGCSSKSPSDWSI